MVEGPHRFGLAAALSCALAMLMVALGATVGIRPMLLDLAAIAFFGVLIVAGLVVDDSALHWLDRWAGELSNAMIATVALLSILLRTPFTIQYARESVPREHWKSPRFIHINCVLAWTWTAAFAITAIVGYIGDGPLHQPDNLWTNLSSRSRC
ncbi:MAG: hypothetical protein ACR2IP_13565 [Solirubrobacteraceae bacterium]